MELHRHVDRARARRDRDHDRDGGQASWGPEAERLGKALGERGPSDSEVGRRIRRILVISRIDLVVLLLVVADMVFKPGA